MGPGPGQQPYYDFYAVLLLDKSYKTYGRQGGGQQSFKDFLDHLEQASRGRFQYEFLPDSHDPWKDRLGFRHASPRPGAGPAPSNIQLDLTASSGSVSCTSGIKNKYLTLHTGVLHKILTPRGECVCKVWVERENL